jgi:hypothetical protein
MQAWDQFGLAKKKLSTRLTSYSRHQIRELDTSLWDPSPAGRAVPTSRPVTDRRVAPGLLLGRQVKKMAEHWEHGVHGPVRSRRLLLQYVVASSIARSGTWSRILAFFAIDDRSRGVWNEKRMCTWSSTSRWRQQQPWTKENVPTHVGHVRE